MHRPAVVLPHPDSPTNPSTSPGSIEKVTPSTAFTEPTVRDQNPRLIGKYFLRSRTATNAVLLLPDWLALVKEKAPHHVTVVRDLLERGQLTLTDVHHAGAAVLKWATHGLLER